MKFCTEDFSLDDAPWLGRTGEVDGDQIKTLTENNQCYTMWETADLLKIPKSIKLLVKMKNVSFILQKKTHQFFGQPNTSRCFSGHTFVCIYAYMWFAAL